MECGCKQETTSIVLEGEYGADPLWCAVCQYNLDLDEIALSSDLINELYNCIGETTMLSTCGCTNFCMYKNIC